MSFFRPFWERRIQSLWKLAPIVWLAGVRRTGKTTLAQSLEPSQYWNCDLPSVRESLENPEAFFKSAKSGILIFDEIHQLANASSVLKIAADAFPKLRILATGSSTLVASAKFQDTLTGRKRNLLFSPVLISELETFQVSLEKRLLYGGLPQSLLSSQLDLEFFGEWLDSFYARDIQELYKIEKRQPFLKALEWLLLENGSILEVTKLAQISGISRPTTVRYLDALETTRAISIIRPFSGNLEREIIQQPRVYGFDTGFVCYVQGIRDLPTKDKGRLLENLVLEQFQAIKGNQPMYWRTKQGNEIDFVWKLDRSKVLAIECKWQAKNFDPGHLKIFRKYYPKGKNVVVIGEGHSSKKTVAGLEIEFVSLWDWGSWLEKL